MTLDEIDQSLPNGFHDSKLSALEADFARRELRIKINVDVSKVPDQVPRYHELVVVIHDVAYWFLEAPDPNYKPWEQDRGLFMDGHRTDEVTSKTFPDALLSATPHGKFVYSFYLNDWNTFLHIAAESAEASWNSSQ